jgi:exopolysaccharide biosynthesis polyprenyl glycosylphosphotransferase
MALGPSFREQVFASALRASDLLAMGLGLTAALALRPPDAAASDVLLAVALLLSASASFAALGLYEPGPPRRAFRVLGAVSLATALATGALAGAGAWLAPGRLGTAQLALVWTASTALALAGRGLLRALARCLPASPRGCRNVLVLGSGPRAIRYAQQIEATPEAGARVVGFADEDWPGLEAFRGTGRNLVCDLKNFAAFLRQNVVDELAVALPLSVLHRSTSDPIGEALEQGVTLRFVACAVDASEPIGSQAGPAAARVAVTRFGGRVEGWGAVAKRAIDLAAASALLVLLAPLFALRALAVRLTSAGSAFFVQERVGLNGRTFPMFKFRTMVDGAEALQLELESRNDADGPVFKIADDPRITPLGHFLRRSSLDELPQLLNVLRGEMSLVGPRPLPLRDVDGFREDAHRRRFSVKPGLTGLWQVSGRSTLPFEQWVEHDLRYVDAWSLRMDLEILVKTIPAVLRADGAV